MNNQLPSHLNQLTPGAALLGREFLGFDADGTTASIHFQARAEFANRHGSVLGGFLAAMLDSATGLTLLAGLPPELTAVTTHLDTEFIKPAPTARSWPRRALPRARIAMPSSRLKSSIAKVICAPAR